jgi:hypothetical protein
LAATALLDIITYHGPSYSNEVTMFNPPTGVICSLGKLQGFLQRHVGIVMSVYFLSTVLTDGTYSSLVTHAMQLRALLGMALIVLYFATWWV